MTHVYRAQTSRGKLMEYMAVSFSKVNIFTGQTILLESFRRNDLIRPLEKKKGKKSSLNLITTDAIVYYFYPNAIWLICIRVRLFVCLFVCLFVYRRIPKIAALLTFGFIRQWGPLLSGGGALPSWAATFERSLFSCSKARKHTMEILFFCSFNGFKFTTFASFYFIATLTVLLYFCCVEIWNLLI